MKGDTMKNQPHSALMWLLRFLLVGALLLAAGCDLEDYLDEDEWDEEVEQPAPGLAPAGLTRPPTGGQTEWLVLLYLNADDDVLEKDIFTDFNEAERVGSTDRVTLVAQIDRFDGGFDGDGDWTSARRYYITQDADLSRINSVLLEDLGEVNMADGDTLVDFVVWALDRFPARKVALIMSDHGMGWPGGWSDPDPGGLGRHDITLAYDYDDNLWLMELDEALGKIRKRSGLQRFELIGFDACLMAGLEVFAAVEPHARYAVASQELEPGLGWAYAGFLIDLAFDPGKDGAGLAKSIVDTYIHRDELVTDDAARREYVRENFSVSRASAEEVARELSVDITLSAVDLSALPALMKALDNLIEAMMETDQDPYAEARAYAQAFETPFDESLPSPYIDLGHFVTILMEENISRDVDRAGAALLKALDRAVIAERHGPDRPGASGISIYFPVFDMYDWEDNLGYSEVAARFTRVSQWDEYLDFFFNNVDDDWEDPEDWGGKRGRAGAQPVQVEPLWLSDEIAAAGYPVTIETTVTGKQIAYIYVFLGHLSEDESLLIIDDIDYLEADAVRQVNGIYFPDWGEGPLELSYDFEPVIYAISDGVNTVPALLSPEEYGKESGVYSVEGIFRAVNSQRDRFAKLYFRDEELFKVVTFSRPDGAGAPYVVVPSQGDTFTVLRSGIYLDGDEQGEYRAPAGRLVFGSANFTWVELPAPPGWYVVGIIAEDFDGRQYEQYEIIEVTD
jgi:hypothetical protein